MAKNNYLISGLPGTGKSSICEALNLQGYTAIDADKAFSFRGDPETGLPTTDPNKLTWLWDKVKLERILNDQTKENIFICGSATNRDKFLDRFTQVFILRIDDNTLKHRLQNRTNNNFGKNPTILKRQIAHNKGVVTYVQKMGFVLIDATKSIEAVINEIQTYLK
jgi:gluconate kinase